MLDKYVRVGDKMIVSGQTSGGFWYCKELPAETTKEADKLISEMNKVYNKYNKSGKIEGGEKKK